MSGNIIRSMLGLGEYNGATASGKAEIDYCLRHATVRPAVYLGFNMAGEVRRRCIEDPGLQGISRFYAGKIHVDTWRSSSYNQVLPDPRFDDKGFTFDGDEIAANILCYPGGVRGYLEAQIQDLQDCPGNTWITVLNEPTFNQPSEHITQVVLEALDIMKEYPDIGLVCFNFGMGGPNNKQVAPSAPAGGGSREEYEYTGFFTSAFVAVLQAFREGQKVAIGYHPYWMLHPRAKFWFNKQENKWYAWWPWEVIPESVPAKEVWHLSPFTDNTCTELQQYGSDILMRVEQRHVLWCEHLGYADVANEIPLFGTETSCDSVLDASRWGGWLTVHDGQINFFFEDWKWYDLALQYTEANVIGTCLFSMFNNNDSRFDKYNFDGYLQTLWDFNAEYEQNKGEPPVMDYVPNATLTLTMDHPLRDTKTLAPVNRVIHSGDHRVYVPKDYIVDGDSGQYFYFWYPATASWQYIFIVPNDPDMEIVVDDSIPTQEVTREEFNALALRVNSVEVAQAEWRVSLDHFIEALERRLRNISGEIVDLIEELELFDLAGNDEV